MTNIVGIIAKVLPIIFLIVVGNILQRFRYLKYDTVEDLKKIVVNIALPALLFIAFAGTTFQLEYLLIIIIVFAVCALMLFAGRLFQNVFKVENKYFPALFAGFEAGMLGYSVFVAVYGTDNMFKFAIIDIGQVTFVFLVLISYLQRLNGNALRAKHLVLSFIKSPVIISVFLGILAGGFGVIEAVKNYPVPNSVYETLKLISVLTIPLICLIIGFELKIDLRGLGLPFKIAAVRTAVLFLIAAFVNKFIIVDLLHLDAVFQIALYTMFILPPPFVIPIFMKDGEGDNKQLILNTISVNIIISLALYLVLIVFIKV